MRNHLTDQRGGLTNAAGQITRLPKAATLIADQVKHGITGGRK